MTNNDNLVMSEARLLDFLFENCKDLDSEVVRVFLTAVRADMEAE